MIILVMLGYVILGIYEFIPLYKQKQWPDFWVNAALGATSLIVAVLLSVGIRIPSPEAPIREMIISIFGK
ncbi:MAG: hypothetical protein Q8930_14810 [Bacillota bacterium]|nr:hypothetical protein [Bacillota bacterium]